MTKKFLGYNPDAKIQGRNMKRKLGYTAEQKDPIAEIIKHMANKNSTEAIKLLSQIDPQTNIHNYLNSTESINISVSFSPLVQECTTLPELAAAFGLIEVYKAFESNPNFAHINYPNRHPLHHAALGAHLDICSHILEQGCDVNIKCKKSGRTALGYTTLYAPEHLASTYDMIKLLLDFGADGNAIDLERRSPLDNALLRPEINRIKLFETAIKAKIASETDKIEKIFLSIDAPIEYPVFQYLVKLGAKIDDESLLHYLNQNNQDKSIFDSLIKDHLPKQEDKNRILKAHQQGETWYPIAISALIEAGATIRLEEEFEFIHELDTDLDTLSSAAIELIFNRMSLQFLQEIPLQTWMDSRGKYNAEIPEMLVLYGAKPVGNKYLSYCNPICFKFFLQVAVYSEVLNYHEREISFKVNFALALQDIITRDLLKLDSLHDLIENCDEEDDQHMYSPAIASSSASNEEDMDTEQDTSSEDSGPVEKKKNYSYTIHSLQQTIRSITENHENSSLYQHASFIFKQPHIKPHQAIDVFCDFNRLDTFTFALGLTCKALFRFDPDALLNTNRDAWKLILAHLYGDLRDLRSFENFAAMRAERAALIFAPTSSAGR